MAVDEVQAKWSSAGEKLKYVIYRNRFKKKNAPSPLGQQDHSVLRPADDEPDPAVEALFVAPRSMRNVEAEVPLKVYVDE